MTARTILTKGDKYGRLSYVSEYPSNSGRMAIWLCDCGNEHIARVTHVRNGGTKSCGCYSSEVAAERKRTHGEYYTSVYSTYYCMLGRCTNKKNRSYSDYGGRGITVCERWLESYENFKEDMGDKSDSSLTLERVDNNKGYSPSNCRWATIKEQSNNKRNTVRLTFRGRTDTLTYWSEYTGLKSATIWARINIYGWSVDKALSTPVRG